MSRKRRNLRAIVTYLQESPERSSLFWWLAEHHDEIARANAGKRIRWQPLAAQLASYGLTDRNGKPASAEITRLTWKRVRQFVAEQAAAKQARQATGRLQPSRLPSTWRPPTTDPLAARPPDKPPDRTEGLSRAEANIAAVRRFIKSRIG